MKRLTILLLLIALPASAAQFTVRGKVPAQGNDSTCATPVLVATTTPAVIHVRLTGAVTREDSTVALVPGTPFALTFAQLPAGLYTVRGWASNPGGIGCDTTFTKLAVAPPWRMQVDP